jgi:hypothetical protein
VNEPYQPEVRIFEGALALAGLQQLGIPLEVLVEAVQRAEVERRSCSPFEPSTAPGYKGWAGGLGVIAERMNDLGWTKKESRGLPRVVSPDGTHAVTLALGDSNTGIRGQLPRTKHPRGEVSICLVQTNTAQLDLPLVDARGKSLIPPGKGEDDDSAVTYWLLIYSDGKEVLRAELSLPIGLDDEGRLAFWEERILLDLPGTHAAVARDEEPPLDLPVEVRPKR